MMMLADALTDGCKGLDLRGSPLRDKVDRKIDVDAAEVAAVDIDDVPGLCVINVGGRHPISNLSVNF